ncbi:glycoside hydrolase family 2 protein [Celeribacter baekdonensis]|uniref:beta-mannosidase n=1 Tax=Celeribacter baekdonensis TaxID=875171 RepID=UPI0030D71AD9|tara:strand:+ start:72352 stop:74784 length:2433 start_codon:yes stop_codon:yes gene_type:complete
MVTIELTEGWRFFDAEGDYDLPVSLPFDSVSTMVKAGHAPEPYVGDAEAALRWIAERDWVLCRSVELTQTDVELVLSGLDGVVGVSVNGVDVVTADNAFRTWRVDLSHCARLGDNQIALRFRSVIQAAEARQKAQPFYIPYHKGNCPIANINMLRKQQCDFGWDWNTALAPFGVSGGVSICSAMKTRIAHLHVAQAHHDTESQSVSVTVTAHVVHGEGAVAEMRFAGRRREAVVKDGVAQAVFFIEEPQLWWPNGQGDQPLYSLEIRCGAAVAMRRIGLRRIEHVTVKDAKGTGFKFRVNGRDVFAKGANWIPADALHGRIERDKVRDLLQSAVDAHMNMIRVWGGGRYEPDWFYDLCDDMGLMVWQDFMFACNLYPADRAFLSNVSAEVVEQVQRLQHHACLALWCGDNELLGMLHEFPEARANRDRYLVMYDRLNQTLERALFEADPQANWWPSSPSLGPLNYGDAWHEDSSGDMHVWTVWHENMPFEAYREMTPRFVSEFGFQSFPSMDVIRRFIAPEDRNMASPVMDAHQKNAGGNARIVGTMMRDFRLPERFEDLVYLSQVQQGLAIKTAVTAWRALKPHCMGTLYWQLNDTWPCASWSSLDYGGGWKVLHHMAARFYAPILVTVVPQGGIDVFKLINDLSGEVDVSIQVAAVTPKGDVRPLAEVSVTAMTHKAFEVLELERSLLKQDEFYVFTWQYRGQHEGQNEGGEGGDIHAPKPFKAYDLIDPKITFETNDLDGVIEIILAAEALALFVTLDADQPGRFSANAVTLLPNVPQKIIFVPQDADITTNFTVQHLYQATLGGAK